MNQREIKDRLTYFMFVKDIITSGAYAKLSSSAKVIYPIIGIHINKEGEAFPAISRLQKLSGLSRPSVVSATKELINNGFVTKVKGNSRVSNRYRIVFEYEGSIINELQRLNSLTTEQFNNLTTEVKKSYHRVVQKFNPNKVLYNKVPQPSKEKPQITTNIIKIDKIQDSQINLTENSGGNNIFKKIIKELNLKNTGQKILKDYIVDYSEDWVDRAFTESVRRSKPSLHYMEGILKKWNQAGRIQQGTLNDSLKEKEKERLLMQKMEQQKEKERIEKAKQRMKIAEEILSGLSKKEREEIKNEIEAILEGEGVREKAPGYKIAFKIKERELILNKYSNNTAKLSI